MRIPTALLLLAAAQAEPKPSPLPRPWIGRIREAGLERLPKPREKKLPHGSLLFGAMTDAGSWGAFCKAAGGTEVAARTPLPEKAELRWDAEGVVYIVFKGYGYDPHLAGWTPPIDGKAELRIKPLLVSAGVPGIPGPRALLYRVDRKDLKNVLLKWDLKNPPTVGSVEAVDSDAIGEIPLGSP